MVDSSDISGDLQACIDRLLAGDEGARNELIQTACARLKRLTRKMLHDFPGVHRWEETDDVFQNAMLRLWRALDQVTPQSVPDFVRLASLQIRRELLDLARHYFGAEGHGTHHASNVDNSTLSKGGPVDMTQEPEQLARWTAFHSSVQALPDQEREMFDLLWYHGLTQTEAARALNVSERTVQRRWQTARLAVHRALHEEAPRRID